MNIPFNNQFAALPPRFFKRVVPTPVTAPKLLIFNEELADDLGIHPTKDIDKSWAANVFSGSTVPKGAVPLSMTYGGFQFGHWNPQLGDGRAILLGEATDKNGNHRDIQLKGAGLTPFSRGGDGRAGIGPVVREYIVSEAMSALGVSTTRSLAAVTTGENIYRERPEPGAVLTRVAKSHVRVGTFQHFAYKRDNEAVKLLADHVLERMFPEALQHENCYMGLILSVLDAHAETIAKWQTYGFIHGVMNTDNSAISGETIDYGPCAFMDNYNPNKVFSSIDMNGRYAYANQPRIAQWNLAGFASTLLPLFSQEQDRWVERINIAIDDFPNKINEHYLERMRHKLGLSSALEDDIDLIQDLLDKMEANNADFTQTFRLLSTVSGTSSERDNAVKSNFSNPEDFSRWAISWRKRLLSNQIDDEERRALMCSKNPKFIPRNHLVAEVIESANNGDYEPLHTLNKILSEPFQEQRVCARYSAPPRKDQVVHQTFCGT